MILCLTSTPLHRIIDQMNREPTIYIAGPMRGYADGNFPAFDRQAKNFEDKGWIVINPAEMDRVEGSPPNGHVDFNPETDYDDQEFIRTALKRDMDAICDRCTAIYMMSNWEDSRGAKAEWHLAKAIGLNIYYETPLPAKQ